MPKPILPSGISLEMCTGRAASRYLKAKLREVGRYAEAAAEGDADGVHDMRVGTKRLRESMRLFEPVFPPKRFRNTLDLVEELNDALGRMRDPDVLTGHLLTVAPNVPGADAPVEMLCEHWRESREAAHANFIKVWKRLRDDEDLPDKIRIIAKRASVRTEKVNRLPLRDFACVSVCTRVDHMFRRLEPAMTDETPATLHALRISVKRLKYTLEPFTNLISAFQAPSTIVADTQEILGLIHDFDVLAASIEDFFVSRDIHGDMVMRKLIEVSSHYREKHCADARVLLSKLSELDWELAVAGVIT